MWTAAIKKSQFQNSRRAPRASHIINKPRTARLQFFNVDTAPHGRVRVIVDPDNRIDESDEHNNTAEFAF